MQQYIGIDLGTSSVKLLLMQKDGTVLSSISKEYSVSYPKSGWSEQDPEDWFSQSFAGLAELLETKLADKNLIRGIGISGQMHGLVVLDKNHQVIRPAILWNDGRAEEETKFLNTIIRKKNLVEYTGNIAFAGFTAPKILWMKKNEPEKFDSIHKILLPKDYLIYKLTGAYTTDVSDASGMLLLDVKNRRWSKEMLEICGIREEMLPEIHESYDISGYAKADIVKELGLTENIIVVAGAGDNAAAAVGTGTVENGSCNISIGTSGTVFIASDSFRVGENNAIHSFGHANGKYHLMGCMLSAASCQKWWLEDILGTEDYQSEQKGIKGIGNNMVYFLPYLMGERSPHNDSNVRGAFLGLGLDTTRTQMMESIFEGVSFALKDSLKIAESLGIEIKKTKLCGGGAKSPVWQKILSNVLNLNIEILETEEGPALGAAILAAVACGEYASVEDAAHSIVNVKKIITPKVELADVYQNKYQIFRKLYPSIKGIL